MPDGSPWCPKRWDLICSAHFIGNKKSEEVSSPSYIPTIFPPAYKAKVVDQTGATKRHERFMKRRINKQEPMTTKAPERVVEEVMEQPELDNDSNAGTNQSHHEKNNCDEEGQVDIFLPHLTQPEKTFICNRYINNTSCSDAIWHRLSYQMSPPLTCTERIEEMDSVTTDNSVKFEFDPDNQLSIKEEANEDFSETLCSPLFIENGHSGSQRPLKLEAEDDVKQEFDICEHDLIDIKSEDLDGCQNVFGPKNCHSGSQRPLKLEAEDEVKQEFDSCEHDLIDIKSEDLDCAQNAFGPNPSGSQRPLKLDTEEDVKQEIEIVEHGPINSAGLDIKSECLDSSSSPSTILKRRQDVHFRKKIDLLDQAGNLETTSSKHNSNTSSFKCHICPKFFSYKQNLTYHLKIHSGEKPFKCEICSKQFTYKYNLTCHLKIHTFEKTFKCEICSKRFSNKRYLDVHLKIHTGEKPFKCELCSKRFSHKHHLIGHLKIHSGEKPFKCEKPSKCEKSFQCEICSKRFSYKHHLIGHLKIHTGNKPFQCEICSKRFSYKHHLSGHLKIHSE